MITLTFKKFLKKYYPVYYKGFKNSNIKFYKYKKNAVKIGKRVDGKTTNIALYLIWNTLYNKKDICYITFNQIGAKEFAKLIEELVEELPYKYAKKFLFNYSQNIIELSNSSSIKFYGESTYVCRGEIYDEIYIDEYDHFKGTEFLTDLLPRTKASKKSVKIHSTIGNNNMKELIKTKKFKKF